MENIDEGHITLSRLRHGRDKLRRYRIEIDGAKVGTIAAGESKTFALPLGEHQLRLRVDWCASPAESFALTSTRPSHDLWCCAGGIAHLEDVVIRRNKYIQLGGREEADTMSARAAFDIRHFAVLLLVVVLVAVLIGAVGAAI